MEYSYNDAKVHYQYLSRSGKGTIVFLHGWGRSCDDFRSVANYLKDYDCLLIDFPPFGKSEFSPQKWTIFSYANMVASLCEHLHIQKADFVAHSFGGRVLILLASISSSLVQKCIFASGAGMKPKRGISYHAKVWKYKVCKKFGKQKLAGSADYRALPKEMKGLFQNIVNTHLEEFALQIKQPTLLFWGSDDDQTPLYMARRMKKLIRNSKLKVIKGGSHFAFMEEKLQFYFEISQFLKENE